MLHIRRSLIALSIVVILMAVLLISCNSSSSPGPEASNFTNAIAGSGSTFVDPLMKRWVIGFEQAHPKIMVNYRAIGSGAGIDELKKSMTAFAASDAPLGDEQLKEIPPVIQVPVTAGPVCIIYNIPAVEEPTSAERQIVGRYLSWADCGLERPGDCAR